MLGICRPTRTGGTDHAFVALVFGTLNVIGGFLVTDRMLRDVQGKGQEKALAAADEAKELTRDLPRRRSLIVAFALFIYGLMGLTGPKTAVRGNWIAATGMAIAVFATRDQDSRHRRNQLDPDRGGSGAG